MFLSSSFFKNTVALHNRKFFFDGSIMEKSPMSADDGNET